MSTEFERQVEAGFCWIVAKGGRFGVMAALEIGSRIGYFKSLALLTERCLSYEDFG